jgi:thiol-disulfide isomerase/thioredoxin
MKLKYFVFGVLSAILVIFVSGLILYKYASKSVEDDDEKYLKSEVDSLEISIIPMLDFDQSHFSAFNSNNTKFSKEGSDSLIIINFWAPWCSPCIAELPHFANFIKENQDIQFIISTDDDDKRVAKFLSKNDTLDLPFYKHSKNKISKSFNHRTIPTTYVVDKKNNVAFQIKGTFNVNSALFKDFISSIKC